MDRRRPQILLIAQTDQNRVAGEWSFLIQTTDGVEKFRAHDVEPDVVGERLDLLPVVRGLEAIDEPSRVTILSSSRYVNRGLSNGLDQWRANDWCWEYYGRMVPIKNEDLWRRIDQAGQIHRLDYRRWRFDPPHHGVARGQRPTEPSASRPTLERPPRRRRTIGAPGELAAMIGGVAETLMGGPSRNAALARLCGRAAG